MIEPRGLLVYGPSMINVESEDVSYEEYISLPALRGYMLAKMRDHNGIGIAAPQLGVFKNFLCLQTQAGDTLDMVNPEMLQMWGHELEGFEACLSIPPTGNGCPVARLQQIKVSFGTSESPNSRVVREFSGMDAIVIQHEMDHLTGTFFIDRVSQGRKKDVLTLLNQWKISQTISQVTKERQSAKTNS